MKKGFSLIELMIVVAIIAFLAVVSVPNFMKFLAKSKRAEAYMNLSAIYAAEKAYWAEHGTYSTDLKAIGWQPEGYRGGGKGENFYYTYGFGSGAEGKNYFTGKLETPSSYLAPAQANKNSFLILAAGDIDGDSQPDILSVDQHNTIKIIQDDLLS